MARHAAQKWAWQPECLARDTFSCTSTALHKSSHYLARVPPKMSWQTYVDDHLLVPLPNGGQLSHAAIVGQDGGVWAQDAGFPAVTSEEVQALVRGCDDTTGGYGGLGQSGVKLGGTKYMLIAGEPGSVVRGKKGQEDGVTIKKTVSALVIGIYSKGVQPADCNVIVENMGDYLAGQGI